MDKIIIRGGAPLRGQVRISGSKNSALPCLFATLLTDEEVTLHNVPDLDDIDTACSLLTFIGKKVFRANGSITVSSGKTIYTDAPYELVRRMRASVLVLGPLLARTGRASASLPGGCAIGNRPIDIHISGFESLGAKSDLSEGTVRLTSKKLKGGRIILPFPSVGATENLLMAAALCDGETTILHAAREPEIVDCAEFLNKMGAEIEGAGDDIIKILGRKRLRGAVHTVIPDRIETATFLIAGAITRGKVSILGVLPDQNEAVLRKLMETGLKISVRGKGVREGTMIECEYRKRLDSVGIVTGPYPAFPTDVQAQWMALMGLAKGKCSIKEDIFENRYLHAAELRRMGARIEIKQNRALIAGVNGYSGAHVMVSDLRAGAALVLAGLAAEGETTIHRVYHLDRGYENLEKKLKSLGADIRRIH